MVYDDQFAELLKDNEREGGTGQDDRNRKTAVYIRLSMEDGNVDGRTKLESDSVTSQRILLKSFVIRSAWRGWRQISWNMWMTVSAAPISNAMVSTAAGDMKSGQIAV